MKNLVIVESPAKAKTISRFLGKEYIIKASMGHIRDLPKNRTGVDVNNQFKPDYEISADKKRVIADLKKDLKLNPKIWIATDEDREGEAIGWHLCEALKIDAKTVDRIVFHEITKPAIEEALKNPRKIDLNLVDAQQARRILDRLVGYELSPLLWKKIKTGLSAGRVQSVAVRLIVEREREIREFKPEEYWKVNAVFKKPNLISELVKIDKKIIRPKNKPALINTAEKAQKIKKAMEDSKEYVINAVEKKDGKKQPSPPFTTSTLQQEASRKLGFSVKQTMMIAQRLYEGSDYNIPKHDGGLITYMRTDSLNLSKQAISQSQKVISEDFGEEYAEKNGRTFKTKAKGAQEAHEAIRPVNLDFRPAKLKSYLNSQELRLYKLIWERTIASQMQAARVKNTTIKIEAKTTEGLCELQSKGQIIDFLGFLKVYNESLDEDSEMKNEKEKILPAVTKGEKCLLEGINTDQNFTTPPARYTEASLVKKLESEGIGRPSTYAPTISTIQSRGYVEKNEDKKLVPTDIAEIVNDFLVKHFPNIVDLKFTANVEEDFDEIASGKQKWNKLIKNFYDDFHKNIKIKEETITRAEVNKERKIGVDPKSGKDVTVKVGPYGPFAQIGSKEDEEKPRYAALEKGTKMDDLTLEEVLSLFKFPRVLGKTKKGQAILVNRGRFNPYVQIESNYYSIRDKDINLFSITKQQALEIVKSEEERKKKMQIKIWKEEDIQILNGPYGAYIKYNKKNYKIVDKTEKENAAEITLERAREIIAMGPTKKFKRHKTKK